MAPIAARESAVEAGGARLRYLEAGQGSALIHLQPPGEWRLTRADDLLCQRFRVMAMEVSPDVTANTVALALTALGIERLDLLGSSRAAETAVGLALLAPDRVQSLVLESPSRPDPTLGDGDDGQAAPLAVPTLVTIGTRDSAAEAARAFANGIADAHLVFVYDAGPAIGEDRAEAFAEVVADFLERREAFVISRADTVIHP